MHVKACLPRTQREDVLNESLTKAFTVQIVRLHALAPSIVGVTAYIGNDIGYRLPTVEIYGTTSEWAAENVIELDSTVRPPGILWFQRPRVQSCVSLKANITCSIRKEAVIPWNCDFSPAVLWPSWP